MLKTKQRKMIFIIVADVEVDVCQLFQLMDTFILASDGYLIHKMVQEE